MGQSAPGAKARNPGRVRHSTRPPEMPRATIKPGRPTPRNEAARLRGKAARPRARTRNKTRSVLAAKRPRNQPGKARTAKARCVAPEKAALCSSLKSSIRVHDVPIDIVDIVPEYRGFRYFIVRDEVVIVDPETLKIVAIIPA